MNPTNRNKPGEHVLRLLFWESTARCNLHCAHCRRIDADAPATNDLTTDQARGLIDSAAELGRPIFVFSGGEPLLRDDWRQLADYARSRGLTTALASNGTLIDATLARRIAEAGFARVAVSLDGADAATHDGLRGRAGAFDAAVAGARALRDAAVPVQINTTLTTGNFGRLDAVLELTRALGARALHLFVLVPVGCGLELAKSAQLSPGQVEEALEWICRHQAQGDIELRATCAPHYYRVAAQLQPQHEEAFGAAGVRGLTGSRGCLAGVGILFVSHSGKVFPCGYLPISCGDVRRDRLADIWESSDLLNRLRDYDLLTGKCGCCEYKIVCGGCRARAYAAGSDYLAEEPMCAHRPAKG